MALQTPVRRRSWLTPLVLVAGHAVKHVFNASFFIILPEITAALHLTNTQVGIMATARSSIGSLTNLPAGFLADRFSNHWGMVLGLCMAALGVFTFLMGALRGYWAILIVSTIAGAATAFWHPAAISALSRQFPERKGFALSLHGSGGSIGEALGPLVAGTLLLVLAWQAILQLSLLPALVTAAVVWLLLRNVRSAGAGALTLHHYLRSLRLLVSNRGLLTLLLGMAAYSAGYSSVATFLPIYLRLDLDYSSFETAAFLSSSQVAGIVSQPFMGLLSDRLGRRVVLVPCLLLLSAGIIAMGMAPPGLPLFVTVVLMGAFQFPLMALFLASAMDLVDPEVQGTTTSLVFGSSFLFSSVAPGVAGVLADELGVAAVFYYGAAIVVAGAALLRLKGKA